MIKVEVMSIWILRERNDIFLCTWHYSSIYVIQICTFKLRFFYPLIWLLSHPQANNCAYEASILAFDQFELSIQFHNWGYQCTQAVNSRLAPQHNITMLPTANPDNMTSHERYKLKWSCVSVCVCVWRERGSYGNKLP